MIIVKKHTAWIISGAHSILQIKDVKSFVIGNNVVIPAAFPHSNGVHFNPWKYESVDKYIETIERNIVAERKDFRNEFHLVVDPNMIYFTYADYDKNRLTSVNKTAINGHGEGIYYLSENATLSTSMRAAVDLCDGDIDAAIRLHNQIMPRHGHLYYKIDLAAVKAWMRQEGKEPVVEVCTRNPAPAKIKVKL